MTTTPLLQRLEGLDARFEEISTLITDPAVIADKKRYVKLSKEYKDLERLLAATGRYRKTLADIDDAKQLLESESDEELREMAKDGAIAAFVGGVTEPPIYTIYLKRPRTMLAISLAMGITGFCISLFHVGAYAASASSFLGLTSFLAGGMDNLLRALPPIASGMVSAFILVMVLGVDEKKPTAEKAQA